MLIPTILILLICTTITLHALDPPRGYLLNCGSTEDLQTGNLKYISDKGFIKTGNGTTLKDLKVQPLLSTLRYFPDKTLRRNCYSFPAVQASKHLVRTTYYYGGFDGGKTPPIFNQFIDGSKWSVVNTTDDFASGMSSYYELIVTPPSETIAVCFARNEQTSPDSSPFISAIEVMLLDDLVYKPVDFGRYMLGTVARHSFGVNSEGLVSFPDDPFNRYWQPYNDSNPIVKCKSNVTSSVFWNTPPAKVFSTAITTSRGKTLELDWPKPALPPGKYYIALYFQDNRNPSPYSWRVFNVALNGAVFFSRLNVSAAGVAVYAAEWPLAGPTKIVLSPEVGIPVGPVMNAGEMLQMLPLGGRTIQRDVVPLGDMAKSLTNLPSDWVGDPCLPKQYAWTGVDCSQNPDLTAHIITLNLTGMGLSGSLPMSIANLTDLANLYLANNKLTGRIPDMSLMKSLQSLHLENNQLEGVVPQSLATLPNIKEIYLQGNKLDPDLPNELKKLQGINIQT